MLRWWDIIIEEQLKEQSWKCRKYSRRSRERRNENAIYKTYKKWHRMKAAMGNVVEKDEDEEEQVDFDKSIKQKTTQTHSHIYTRRDMKKQSLTHALNSHLYNNHIQAPRKFVCIAPAEDIAGAI